MSNRTQGQRLPKMDPEDSRAEIPIMIFWILLAIFFGIIVLT